MFALCNPSPQFSYYFQDPSYLFLTQYYFILPCTNWVTTFSHHLYCYFQVLIQGTTLVTPGTTLVTPGTTFVTPGTPELLHPSVTLTQLLECCALHCPRLDFLSLYPIDARRCSLLSYSMFTLCLCHHLSSLSSAMASRYTQSDQRRRDHIAELYP